MRHTNMPPSTAITPVKNAPAKQVEGDPKRRFGGASSRTSTSTPTWMPVRTP